MSEVGHEFHFLAESPDPPKQKQNPGKARHKSYRPLRTFRVPCRPTALYLGRDGRPHLRNAAVRKEDEQLIFEPYLNRLGQPRLLMINRTEYPLRVNGQPASRVAILKEKDYVRWHATVALHLTAFQRPNIVPPTTQMLGKECPICRVPFSTGTKCYLCACGAAMHCEDSADGLQCAHLRADCPSCHRPIVLKEGYSYLPELDHE